MLEGLAPLAHYGGGRGPWVCVGIGDEAVDRVRKLLQGPKDAPLQAPPGQKREQALDCVEPG
jgi:hypothetical protein